MKFVKLLLPRVPDPERFNVTEWRLVLSTHADVMAYAEHEEEFVARAFVQLGRTPDGLFDAAHARDQRVGAVGAMLNVAYLQLKEGHTFHPIHEVGKMVNRKIKTMLTLLDKGWTISINHKGGYCDHAGYLQTWNATEVDSVDTQTTNFPKVA